MASADQLSLSDFIKSVHQNLRDSAKIDGSENAWQKHCSNEENLRKYADAMQKLACEHWEQNIGSKTGSRILWTVDTCENYFLSDIDKFRTKENDIALRIDQHISDLSNSGNLRHVDKLTLLDVGSCYNPFGKFERFDVTAIDLAPATNEVIKCDFLALNVGENLIMKDNELLELPKNHFNVVVFSLLLEYLPSPKQRLLCCEKAYELLTQEGLLIIITPDSNHVGINVKYMKSWRYVLARMGFSRIKYEKFQHIHCMAFRKALSKAVASRWADLHDSEQLFNELYIPQDFNNQNKEQNKSEKGSCNISEDSKKNYVFDFNELPECDIFK